VSHNCEKQLNKTNFYIDHAFHPVDQSQAPDGYVWDCPVCKKLWEHVCDEAEGCSWMPAPKGAKPSNGPRYKVLKKFGIRA
jgi:hypothetical protein